MGIREFEIGIIGAGTAGLTAALYGARAGRSVVLFEEKTFGGSIVATDIIENYPGIFSVSGVDFASGLLRQVKEQGVFCVNQKVTGINIKSDSSKSVITGSGETMVKSVILAPGREPVKLGLQMENELIGKGVSYCATCDGSLFRNKIAAVIGGGNSAISEAIYLSGLVKLVYIINKNSELSGEAKRIDEVKKTSNIRIISDSKVTQLYGENKLVSIVITENSTGRKEILDVDGLFVAIGYKPHNKGFSNVVELDDDGYILTDENCETGTAGVFAAGDACRKKIRQLTTAASDGTVAALAAVKYLEEGERDGHK